MKLRGSGSAVWSLCGTVRPTVTRPTVMTPPPPSAAESVVQPQGVNHCSRGVCVCGGGVLGGPGGGHSSGSLNRLFRQNTVFYFKFFYFFILTPVLLFSVNSLFSFLRSSESS